MDVCEMSTAFVNEALHAAAPLLDRGYAAIDHGSFPQYFGSGWVMLTRSDVRVRILNDRGQWFVEIGSSAAPEEWFDARLVLSEIGDTEINVTTDQDSVEALCRLLAKTGPRWESLFLQSTFAAARSSLRAREIASARDRFGPSPELL